MTQEINPVFSYIKLHHHGKIPVTEWRQDGRALVADVREWVAQGYNLGVRCDRQSGVWVLDVDVDVHTLQPSQEWLDLLEENPLPETFTVRTPSGGMHYYFKLPRDIEVRNDQGAVIAKGVDIRGTGGYVVAPGMYAAFNKHGVDFAGHYEILDDSAPAETPDWIAELFQVREEVRAAKVEARADAQPQPKMETTAELEAMGRKELNDLFALAAALTALPDGESMTILGEERGWERGSGFFVLACKIIEVARWPYVSITVEQAHEAWIARVPPKYAGHDWNNALDQAGQTWEYGEQRRNPVDLFEGVPYRGGVNAPVAEAGAATQVLDVSDKPIGWAIGQCFAKAKDDADDENSGGFKVDTARRLVIAQGKVAIDQTGSLWTYQDGVYVHRDKVVLDRLYRMLGDKFTATSLTNVKYAVQATAPLLDLTRAPSPGIMNFTNGTLEWRSSDETKPHRDDTLATTQFPYDWDAEAGCPKFDHWLATMLEPDQIALAWKVLGYMMLSGNPLQVAFMLYGKGSNGKSTFAHVVEHLIGIQNASAVPLKDFSVRFATAAMIGKVANVVGDIDKDFQMSTAALKQITGSDALQFERKGRDSFRATLWATCLFSANSIPGTNDGSEGYEERWVPINFKRKASEHRIEGFSEEGLWEEIPGIAAKAVRALRALPLNRGSDRSAAFDLSSDSSLAAVEDFREASNSYYSWVKNHTSPSEIEVMKPKELWAEFRSATGTRNGGLNCPASFQEVLSARYGEPKMRRGLYMGLQRNVRGYAVAVLDDDAAGSLTEHDIFGDVSASGH